MSLEKYKEAYQTLYDSILDDRFAPDSEFRFFDRLYTVLIKDQESHMKMLGEAASIEQRIEILENLCYFVQKYEEVMGKAIKHFRPSYHETVPYKRTLISYLLQDNKLKEAVTLSESLIEEYQELFVAGIRPYRRNVSKETSQKLAAEVSSFLLEHIKYDDSKIICHDNEVNKVLCNAKDTIKLLLSVGRAYVQLEDFDAAVICFEHAQTLTHIYKEHPETFNELRRGEFNELNSELISAKAHQDASARGEDLTNPARGENKGDFRLSTLLPSGSINGLVKNKLYHSASIKKEGQDDLYMEHWGISAREGFHKLFYDAARSPASLPVAGQEEQALDEKDEAAGYMPMNFRK